MKYKRLAPVVDPVVDELVSVFQYYEGSLKIGKGRVKKVNGEVIEFSSDIEDYCSGFPLLN